MFRPHLFAIFREFLSSLIYAAYASNYMVGILHVIKIIIKKIKYHKYLLYTNI